MTVPDYHWPETVFAVIGVATLAGLLIACVWVGVTRAVRRRRARAYLLRDRWTPTT